MWAGPLKRPESPKSFPKAKDIGTLSLGAVPVSFSSFKKRKLTKFFAIFKLNNKIILQKALSFPDNRKGGGISKS
ncbi:hypothetical protein HMPREF9413_4559 [Paenibacillus sp. HGF7]|nr:hypothetical protein HMPREF9413_4559 [Paenibacillus sp. HGF7]